MSGMGRREGQSRAEARQLPPPSSQRGLKDFCQALGVHPDHKYEQHGGPSMEKCLQLLGGSADAAADKTYFLLTQLAFWLMAASMPYGLHAPSETP